MRAVTCQFLYDVSAFIEAGHGETAVGRGLISADNRAAGAGSAGQVLHLEHGIADSLAGDRIELINHQRAEGRVLEGYSLAFTGLDEHFLRGRVFDAVAGYRFHFRDLVPAVLQIGELELTIGIGIEITKVVDLTAFGITAGIDHLELCALQRLARHAADLVDSQAGLLVVFKVNRMVTVGIEGHELAGSIQQIGGGNGLLGNFIDAGKQVLQLCTAIRSGADLIDAMTVGGSNDEYGVGDGLAGVCIVLIDVKVGADLVLNDQRAGLSGEQLHLVLPQVDDVVRNRGGLAHGIHAGFQIAYQNLTILVGGAIQIMCPVFDFRNSEGDALQRRTVRAELDELQGGLDGIGENKLGILVGVQLNDALGLINDIALTGFLRDHISACGKLAQVDLTIFIGSELLGAIITGYGFDLKDRIGNDLGGIGAIHLHKAQAGLDVIEEQQLLDAVSGLQLHFLRGRVQNVAIAAGIHFYCAVSAGFYIGEQNLAKCIGAEGAQRNAVTPDLEGDAGHGDHIFAVILDDPQTGQLFIDQVEGGRFTGHHGRSVDGIIQQPTGRRCLFFDAIGAGPDLTEHGNACGIGLSGVSLAALNMGDRNKSSGQIHAGVGGLFDTEIAVRLVFKNDLGHLAVDHLHILRRLLAEQIILRRDPFVHGVISGQGQRNADLTGGVGGKGANGGSIRTYHLEHGATQRDGGAGLVLDDLQAGIHLNFGLVAVIAVGGQFHLSCGVGVNHVILQIAIFIHFHNGGVEDGVLVNIQIKGQLDAAGLTGHAVCRIKNLELGGIPLAGGAGGQGGNVVVVHVHDAGAGGNAGRVRKGDIDLVIAYPGLGRNSENLLLILAAVDGHLIGNITVRRTGDVGGQIFRPCGATAVDVLCRSQDLLGTLQFKTGQIGIDGQIVDIPVGQDIAPKGHFGRVIGVVLVFKPQLAQTAVGIAVGYDSGDLGIGSLFISQILDALALGYLLRHTINIGIDAICRDLFDLSGRRHIVVIGVILLPDTAIYRQIGHRYAAIINIDLAQSFLLRRGCEGCGREHTKKHDDG